MQVQVEGVATGEYASVCGRHILERKNSIDALISFMTIGHDRFEHELKRIGSCESASIFVFRSERALSSFKKLDF